MRTEFLCISVLRVASGPRVKLASCKSALNPPVVCSADRSKAGWPRTLENRENGEKKSLQGKIREFEILLKIREKSGNFKKYYLCKVKIFKFYSCSDVATGGFFLPYA